MKKPSVLVHEPAAALHKRPTEHALAVVKAAVNAIPVVGGSLGSLIGDYIPTSTQKNTQKAIDLLGDKLAALGERIDVNAVDNDEFSELFKSCYLVIVRTHREEKLRGATNILLTLLLRPNDAAETSYDELDHLIRCIDSLSVGALYILGVVHEIASLPLLRSSFPFGELQTKTNRERSFLMSMVSELRALNLIYSQEPSVHQVGDKEFDGFFMHLTPIGKKLFEQFIEGKM
jgi:hypothetical protein